MTDRSHVHPRGHYLRILEVAMRDLAGRRGLSWVSAYRAQLGVVEGVAHELAHQLEAGRSFERCLREAWDQAANLHEAATLRIEVASLAAFGVRVSLRRLWRDANWRGDRPTLTRARRVLDDRERRCVRVFVRVMERALAATTTAPGPERDDVSWG